MSDRSKFDVVNPPELGAPRGYSNGMSAQPGRMLFVAGQIGCDKDMRTVSDRFCEQFEQALSNIMTVVRAAGGEASDIGRLTIYVTDKQEYINEIKEVGAAYRRQFGKHFPAMALIEVKSLLEPSAKVEIEATAVI
jgi:enamine deaminase RidA (YjgF/YER057c/UK114 family)